MVSDYIAPNVVLAVTCRLSFSLRNSSFIYVTIFDMVLFFLHDVIFGLISVNPLLVADGVKKLTTSLFFCIV